MTIQRIGKTLLTRHMAKAARSKSGNLLKGPVKVPKGTPGGFEEHFRRLIDTLIEDFRKDAAKS